MKRLICVGSGYLFVMSAMFGQSASDPPKFEVASVKPVEGPAREAFVFSSSGPRMTLKGYHLKQLVLEAYGVKLYQVLFSAKAPKVPDTLYNVFAEAADNTVPTRNEFRQMLRSLLAERFKLEVHREARQMPVYALVVGKNGPKFKESAPDAVFQETVKPQGRYQSVSATKATMDNLADLIKNYTDLPVVDNTGLMGAYDIQLRANVGYRDDTSDLSAMSIVVAVQEQLGLKLVSEKATMEVIVVDYFEKPSAD